MTESTPTSLRQIMIAAADLEKAEFERDRLALAYRDAVLEAFAAGEDPAALSAATGIPEAELTRIAALAPTAGPGRNTLPL